MLRRLAVTLCLVLAFASSGLWARSCSYAAAAGYDSPGLNLSLVAEAGTVKLFVRTTEGRRWRHGRWEATQRPASPLRGRACGTARIAMVRGWWVRVPLAVPTFALALSGLWLWCRGRRTKAVGFEALASRDDMVLNRGV